MLKFLVFDEHGSPPKQWPLRNAYLIGPEGMPIRGEIFFEPGMVICEKREPGTAALTLQHESGELGSLTLQTCLLPEREDPYVLALELARHRLMVLYEKQEDWGMFGLSAEHPVARRTEQARRHFVEALCTQRQDPAHASAEAQQCLIAALDGTEELALAHSELLLNFRKQQNDLPAQPIGCGVNLEQINDRVRMGMVANFDFVQLPTPWKSLAPEEGEYRWEIMDSWMQWTQRSKMKVIAGPLIDFTTTCLPDWLYIWEHDYETVRDLIYEHLEQVITRYKDAVTAWNVVSGLHVNKNFSFNFEQLMDLTRMGVMLVKKIAPQARAIVELREPWGEYYASNPRSIPPLMYADLIQQSGIRFDGFGVRLPMGQAVSGQFTRDLMQISQLLDQVGHFGKPVFLTAAAPSEPVTQMMIAAEDSNEPVDADSGCWRRAWSPSVQSHWMEAIFQIALSKPYVAGVAWQDLVDHPKIDLPLSGLVGEDLEPKPAYERLVRFRRNLSGERGSSAAKVPDG